MIRSLAECGDTAASLVPVAMQAPSWWLPYNHLSDPTISPPTTFSLSS